MFDILKSKWKIFKKEHKSKKRISKFALKFSYYICYLLPVQKKLVFVANNTDRLDRNPKYIYDEIKKQNLDLKIVLMFNPAGKKGKKNQIKFLLKNMLAEYHMATANFIILDAYYFPLYVIKTKKKTTVIQVWHASGGFKKIGYSVLGNSFGVNEKDIKINPIHTNYTYCLMGSKYNAKFYAEAFNVSLDKFVTDVGIPRTDVFFNEELKIKLPDKIFEMYNIPRDKKIILYAPTFRGAHKISAYFKDDLDFNIMKENISDDYIILLKLHPWITEKYEISEELKGFLFDVSDYPDINELMIISDVMITDYSSAIFEYSLLEKPMLFYASDYFDYIDERGFYIDFHNDLPGKVYTDTLSMAKDIKDNNFEMDRVRDFKKQTFEVADGKSSERFVNELIKPNMIK
ncbi:CDP-glycerol glycerophosphotransferase family protein [Anaerofustis stercorihominis]|uniref:CDP-glycerol--glycerophosphate glycerophosphotransferase n=1 Tax=Anaerofustis stercorihominis TaxID=214853 RepID=A0A3E3E2X1_9FIRM|nr:CDP-glycerol glycerophosphotransferase family protein [Anaerofustis stercorihominis]RGD75519.1 CDP-glycerol--glycerophosphate glycerophosphotransferase [Anaerofustis stercorihominis]